MCYFKVLRVKKYKYFGVIRISMNGPDIEIKALRCRKCGWTWYPRSPRRPEVCPSCKCREWDNDNKVFGTERVRINFSIDSKLRNEFKDSQKHIETYNGRPITEELAFEIGVKCILNREAVQ